jgi:cellulose synthase/poly-beta-1,6-N-acetylglucosamine synthase-like glycosyltransferase
MIIIEGLSYTLIAGITYRSILNLVNLTSNLNWLQIDHKTPPHSDLKTHFVICIPMLREQKIVEETLEYFSKLNYPKTLFKVYVVTTEKEISQKEQNKQLLEALSKDISSYNGIDTVKNKYAKIFNLDLLSQIYKEYKGKNVELIKQHLLKEYNNYPTTHKLAEDKINHLNKKIGTDVFHVLNYPYIEGVMSHQINYLKDYLQKKNLDKNTFFAVYNADSRPNLNTLLEVAIQSETYEKNE